MFQEEDVTVFALGVHLVVAPNTRRKNVFSLSGVSKNHYSVAAFVLAMVTRLPTTSIAK